MTTFPTSTQSSDQLSATSAAGSAPRAATRIDEPEELLALLCAAADETKAHEIVILDVRGQTIIADFFVLCTGTSSTHVQAIAQNVVGRLRVDARRRAKPEGDSESLWIVLDYSDVILHVFDATTREFYDLERLWADAKIAPYVSLQPANPAAVAATANAEAAGAASTVTAGASPSAQPQA